MYRTAYQMAAHDIAEELEKEYGDSYRSNEIYYISPYMIYTKKTRYLNKKLRINKINFYNNQNGVKNEKLDQCNS